MSFDPIEETVAVIDVGSNSIKLLVAARGADEPVISVRFVVEETRIGEGMTTHPPTISQDAIERGAAAIARLVEAAGPIRPLCIVATSAARDAFNRQQFVDAVERACGHELRILSGDEEAAFIARGARCDPKLAGISAFSLLDLGGGSLECIQFSGQRLIREQSLRLGSVRLASLLVPDRRAPLDPDAQALVQGYVEDAWKASAFQRLSNPGDTAILAGGSATQLGGMLEPELFDSGIDLATFSEMRTRICRANYEERVEKFGIPASRADIFPTALVTLETSLRYLGCERIRFTHYNLRYGVADVLLSHGGIPDELELA